MSIPYQIVDDPPWYRRWNYGHLARAGVGVASAIIPQYLASLERPTETLRHVGVKRRLEDAVDRYSKRLRQSGSRRLRIPRNMPYRTGFFRKARGVPINDRIYYQRGTVFTQQHNNVYTSNECVYLGHGFGPSMVAFGVFEALIVALFRKAGYNVKSTQERIQGEIATTHATGPGTVFIRWKTSPGVALSTHTFVVAADSTFHDFARVVVDWWLSLDSTLFDADLIWKEISFVGTNEGFASAIDLTGLWIDMKHTSTITLQNRTVAQGAGTEEGLITDVAANPLVGRVYNFNASGGKLRVGLGNSTVSNFPLQFAVRGASGITQTGMMINTFSRTDKEAVQVCRPVLPNAFVGCVSSRRVSMAPGAIQTSVLHYKTKMTFQNFYLKMVDYIHRIYDDGGTAAISNNSYLGKIGKSQFFGLERKITAGTEPVVTVGGEVSQVFKTRVYTKHSGVMSYQNTRFGEV